MTTTTEASNNFTARDLLRLAGLTYRQLNDWEQRAGILSSERATSEGWRKFTGEQTLALCVCAALREQFAVPLKKIGQLYLWLVGRKPDNATATLVDIAALQLERMQANEKIARVVSLTGDALSEALKDEANQYIVREFIRYQLNLIANQPMLQAAKLASFGFPVFLCTSFDSSLILTEVNLVHWIARRHVGGPTIIYPLNEAINEWKRVVQLPPDELDSVFPSLRDQLRQLQEQADVTASEHEVLRLIREKAYQRVTVHVAGSEVIQLDVEEDLLRDGVQEKILVDVIKSKAYQTVTVTVADGKVVSLNRKSPIKLRRRREKPEPRSQ